MTDKEIKEQRIGLRNVGRIDPERIEEYIAADGYLGFKKALAMKPGAVIKKIMDSGLRGRGGAGFPTGLKWKFTRQAKGNIKYMVTNADEGEPGTFKDRFILEQDPHSCLEGMMIAAYAVGTEKGFIYIRGEYYLSIKRMEKAIQDARQKGLLGENILGSGFSLDLEVKLGAGSYVCGDESALIESLEGKRGFPPYKTAFPGGKGVFDRPTVVNNVETLSHVAPILVKGPAWYKKFGTEKSAGTKIFAISGDVVKPGVYEVEMGTPLKGLIETLAGGISGGKQLKTILAGGAAGTFIPPGETGIAMDFDSLREKGFTLGSGALIVLNEDASLSGLLENIIRFFHHESCGKCVPCRVGMEHLDRLIKQCLKEPAQKRAEYLEKMQKLSLLMAKTSLCPLGQSPIFPIKSIWDHNKAAFLNS